MLGLAPVGFAVNFWAWALLSRWARSWRTACTWARCTSGRRWRKIGVPY